MQQDVSIVIQDSERAPIDVTLQVEFLSFGSRMWGAFKILLAFWAAALLSVFIPLAHFILVPGCLLAGPIFAALRFRKTVLLSSHSLPCPKCAQPIAIGAHTLGWPIGLLCPECSSRLSIRPRA